MKKIKKIIVLITVFILNIYNTCLADLVAPRELIPGQGQTNTYTPDPAPKTTVNYTLIGIIVLVVVICSIFIIVKTNGKKKENKEENK